MVEKIEKIEKIVVEKEVYIFKKLLWIVENRRDRRDRREDALHLEKKGKGIKEK